MTNVDQRTRPGKEPTQGWTVGTARNALLKRVTQQGSPFTSCVDVAVAAVLASELLPDDNGTFSVFKHAKAIAAEARCSERACRAALKRLECGFVIARTYAPRGGSLVTKRNGREYRHRCARYTFVENPEAFAHQQKQARTRVQVAFNLRADEAHGEVVRLQAALLNGQFGEPRTTSNPAYTTALRVLQRKVQGRLPASVVRTFEAARTPAKARRVVGLLKAVGE